MFTGTNYLLARKMLDYTTLRQEALASNLANVEVAGYRRIDVSPDFQTELNKAVGSGKAEDISNLQPKLAADLTTRSTRGDGNNVEMDRELMAMNSNATDQEYVIRYLNYNFQLTRTAITSQS
ncbi:MAG TPA: flagellar basal body rod protein FlgB [Opitutales bacterium]|nr:flagellar basal body rod protein FlgB [Opitutales bacterium]